MRLILFLALGGATGTVARYLVSGLAQPAGGTFPWGTLAVNVIGAFILGFLMRYVLATGWLDPDVRAGLTIGLCGGFTTMSTFAYETVTLMTDGDYWRAGGYVAISVIGSVAAAFGGLAFATRLL